MIRVKTPTIGARLTGLFLAVCVMPLTALAATGQEAEQAVEQVPVEYSNAGMPLAEMPFSAAVRVGDLLILSGQIGNLPGTTTLAPGGIKAEARQALENVKHILEANGSSMDRVVKCTVMIADIDEWADFNEVYVSYFPGPKPARSAFEASGLAFDGRIELECWAAN